MQKLDCVNRFERVNAILAALATKSYSAFDYELSVGTVESKPSHGTQLTTNKKQEKRNDW